MELPPLMEPDRKDRRPAGGRRLAHTAVPPLEGEHKAETGPTANWPDQRVSTTKSVLRGAVSWLAALSDTISVTPAHSRSSTNRRVASGSSKRSRTLAAVSCGPVTGGCSGALPRLRGGSVEGGRATESQLMVSPSAAGPMAM